MKRMILASLLLTGLIFAGCEDDPVLIEPDPPPATPQGVFSVTGDGVVYVVFNGIYEHDVKEYIVWRSLDPVDNYAEIGRVTADDNPNLNLIIYEFADNTVTNGVTYYYAVASVDHAGQVSELSAEDVFDTPRPEGVEVLLTNDVNNGLSSGFSLAAGSIVSDTSDLADVYVDRFNGVMYLNAGNLNFIYGDIQDMGYTYSFDDVGWAPREGWSANGFVELILGHTYVIWTVDGNFAKIRVNGMSTSGGWVNFDWAYQTDTDNQELSPAMPNDDRRPRPDKGELLSASITATE